jgi:hypothetical protein
MKLELPRNHTFFAAALAALLLGVGSAATADVVSATWDSSGRFQHEAAVEPGRFTEVCADLPSQSSVEWRFESTEPSDFNVHYHVGPSVLYAAQVNAVKSHKGRMTAKVGQQYCWMWKNTSTQRTQIKVQLRKR